jgi:glycosyltransferase involved in cell wall biosynthesis
LAACAVVRRVGINAVFLEPQLGGLETYVRQIVPALLDVRPQLELVVYVGRRGHNLLRAQPWSPRVQLRVHPLLGRAGTRAVTETTLLGWLASRDRVDVLHNVALTAPIWTKPVNVVLVADVTWLRQPETVGRARSVLWRTLVLPAARRADRIITLSEAAKREIVGDVGIPADRIDVVPLAASRADRASATPEGELRRRLDLGSGPVVLAVSALTPHKNVAALLDALVTIRAAHPDVMLVIPGNPSAHGAELERRADALGVAANARFPGWVSARDLEGLYALATCFAFPSIREGFGLPLLEAMERDVPVVAARASAVPEVAGDAALYFDPHRRGELAAALQRLLSDAALREELVAKGDQRRRQFTWRRTAEETLQSFERALG